MTFLFLALFGAGCASMPAPYKPATEGRINNAERDVALEIRLDTETPVIAIGDPIFLIVTIRNVGPNRVWLPQQPTVLISWIYPDGIHDNFLKELREEERLAPHQLVCLEPNQQISQRVEVRTYYFDRLGVTEFRALLHTGRNTNPDTGPTWMGRLQSNSFGVRIERRTKKKMSDFRIVNGDAPDQPDA
ncbi:MAG: hypothetical protein KJ726_03505 [Verrucomicrobia bacterium]|nr:hypothetical protein [Verrucomicrobiota bacterium]